MNQATRDWLQKVTNAWKVAEATGEQWEALSLLDIERIKEIAYRLKLTPEEIMDLWSRVGIAEVYERYRNPEREDARLIKANAGDDDHHEHAGFVDLDELTHSLKVMLAALQIIIQKGFKGLVASLEAEASLVSRNAFAWIKGTVVPEGIADIVSTLVISALNIYFGKWAAGGGFHERHEAKEEIVELRKRREELDEKIYNLDQNLNQPDGRAKSFLEIESINAHNESDDLSFRLHQNKSLHNVANSTATAGTTIAVQSFFDFIGTVVVGFVLSHFPKNLEQRDTIQSGVTGALGILDMVLNVIAALGALALGLSLVQGSGPQSKRFRQKLSEAPDIDKEAPESINNYRQFIHDEQTKRNNFYGYYHRMNTAFAIATTPYVAARALETSLPIASTIAKALGRTVNIPAGVLGGREIALVFAGITMFVNSTQLFWGHDRQGRYVQAVNGNDLDLDTDFLRIVDTLRIRHPAPPSRDGGGAGDLTAAAGDLPETDTPRHTGEELRAAFFAQIKQQHELSNALLKEIKAKKGDSAKEIEKKLIINLDYLKLWMRDMLRTQKNSLNMQIEMKNSLFFQSYRNPPTDPELAGAPDIEETDTHTPANINGKTQDTAKLLNDIKDIPLEWRKKLEHDKRKMHQIQDLIQRFSDPNIPLADFERHVGHFVDLKSGELYGAESVKRGYSRLAEMLSEKNPEKELERRQNIMFEINNRAQENLRTAYTPAAKPKVDIDAMV